MFVRDGVVHHSASDLTAAVACEWALLRRLDGKLGRIVPVEEEPDWMLARAGTLGERHEERQLERYREQYGAHLPGRRGGVAEIERPAAEPAALAAAAAATRAAIADGADVVFQGTFFDGRFVGFADFLLGTERGVQVVDTKLARRAKVTALLQLAAYSRQLEALGVRVHPTAVLLLGDGTRSEHRIADIEPVYDARVTRLLHLIDERVAAREAIEWGAPDVVACGRCAECAVQVESTRDVQLVAGIRTTQRVRLHEAGLVTIDAFAASTGPVAGIGAEALARLRDQAAMQVAAEGSGELRARVHSASGLTALPDPDPGDIFFDFEGDPLWSDATGRDWGIDYLFGVVDLDESGGRFLPFWAHDRVEEKQALVDFLAYVTERRRAHPGLHIYHYADYERAHLLQLSARYGVGEAAIDELLRENVLVDLYPIVRRSVRVSGRSYGLKKLEPLYLDMALRSSEVESGAESIEAYVAYSDLRAAGDPRADDVLAEIAEYNRVDCLSTRALRDWLLGLADEHGVARRVEPEVKEADRALAEREEAVHARLTASLEGVPAEDRTPDQQALALAAAAIDYHRREDKSYWWEHFHRESAAVDDWADQAGVFVVDRAAVEGDWEVRGDDRVESRILRLRGRMAPGTRLDEHPFAMYEEPFPSACGDVPSGHRAEHAKTEVLAVEADGDETEVLLREKCGRGADTWSGVPVALTPAPPVPTRAQRAAIVEWGEGIADALPRLPGSASVDLLRRTPPRLRSGVLGAGTGPADIVDAVLRLDDSYLAVQGPPGSGKTYVGSHVIAALVRDHGWRVGVVAQSHEVVENLLRRVLESGVEPERVGKRPPSRGWESEPPWTALDNKTLPTFALRGRDTGFVLGGTAWDFANGEKVPRGSLDLLVVDEAGQYSLADTIACAVSARSLLLLGDPQQLPQVSTGLHPEPVDRSALGWLSGDHDVLPAEFGVFLDQTWRMHPRLTSAVSTLSYDGRLTAREPETVLRRLAGVEPGLHPAPVVHSGRSTESPEEADAVVELVRGVVGLAWTDPALGRDADPLRPSDVIVVAPYNAQVDRIRRALDEAGYGDTRVGTVDKFQGQEAAIAIVSLTASSEADVPRGIDFLLSRNRLNVAISRAKWAAYLVHSTALPDFLPRSPEGVARLGGFLRLVRPEAAAH